MKKYISLLATILTAVGCIAQVYEEQTASSYDSYYTRIDKYTGGYYTFSLRDQPGDFAHGNYQCFSPDHLAGELTEFTSMSDMIRVNDSVGYALEISPECSEYTVTYRAVALHKFNAEFELTNHWDLGPCQDDWGIYCAFNSVPKLLLVNDSIMYIHDNFYSKMVNMNSGEVSTFTFENPIYFNKSELAGDHSVIIYNSQSVGEMNILTNEWTPLENVVDLLSIRRFQENYVRLYRSFVTVVDDQQVQLANFSIPSSELALADPAIDGNSIRVITEDVNDLSKRIYHFDQNLNLLETVLLEDADELIVNSFLWLDDRFFLAGNRRVNSRCRQTNYRYYSAEGQLLNPRTEDISIDDLTIDVTSAYIIGFGNYYLSVTANLDFVVTNHSEVPLTHFMLSTSRLDAQFGMIPVCFNWYGNRRIVPTDDIAPGESISLSFDNVFLGFFPPQSVGTTLSSNYCFTASAPNHFIDKDQTNDTKCFQIVHVITDTNELDSDAFGFLVNNDGEFIQLTCNDAIQYVLVDMQGRVIDLGKKSKGTNTISTESLSSGIYAVTVWNQQFSKTIRFSK